VSEISSYSFLPWLRRGLANQIKADDFDANVKLRASVTVSLEARGQKIGGGGDDSVFVDQPIALYGPGDITGIDRRAIIRTEPRDWNTNFEPNYCAAIEFYDEDMPWRYTPAAPGASGRLRPWISLVVLSESEFTDGRDVRGKPLPYVEVSDVTVFPKADELWAWAHVHVNRSLAANEDEHVSSDMAAVIPRLQALIQENADLAYSRIISPRRLASKTGYHAFLMPSFEAGRRAGLGLELGDVAATASAWEEPGRPAPTSFPYYHRWYFRTGETGDFESLVRLLTPKVVDPRVGFRDMDMLSPGSNVPGFSPAHEGGVLRLGGALRPPTNAPDPSDDWDAAFPQPLQEGLAELINLPDFYLEQGHPDPVIAPPLYGRWHAFASRVLHDRNGDPLPNLDKWLHRLNLDPRFRVAAGLGTRVIQDGQEDYMDAAWAQIGKVLEARRRIWFGQFGLLTSMVWHEKHFMPTVAVSKDKGLLLIAPLAKRIVTGDLTIHGAMRQSFVQPAMTSAALRRIVRPRGRLVRSLPFTPARPADRLIERVDKGEVSAAPPRETPPGLVTDMTVEDAVVQGEGVPGAIADLLKRHSLLPWIVLAIFLFIALILLLLGLLLPAVLVALAGFLAWRTLRRWQRIAAAAAGSSLATQTPESVDALPAVPGFAITEVGDATVWPAGASDSEEGRRFKAALKDGFGLVAAAAAAGRKEERKPLGLTDVVNAGWASIAPRKTIPRRIMAGLKIPQRIIDDLITRPSEAFVEPMAYPVIDKPMYEPLKDLSSEYLLPNVNLIEPNSITLLKTNQRFIESYMVGLNHEFARELLWREYPTDQRGSSFRQFWDVDSFFNADNLNDEDLKETLRDIPPLHLWAQSGKLGDHDHRELPGENEDELVLAIRGELLKRYPNAVIYAHRAAWQRKPANDSEIDLDPVLRTGPIDPSVERRLAPLSAAEEANPPKTKVRTPLYGAKIDPDITFFGFDLTRSDAEGGTGANPNDDPGWFFVIKERPGEPRFGLDTGAAATLHSWNDLSWDRFQPVAGPNASIAAAPAALPVSLPSASDEQREQGEEDVKIVWNKATITSAELAYIFFQAPVLVGVHAVEMLPKD
jgi:hypothetical protein